MYFIPNMLESLKNGSPSLSLMPLVLPCISDIGQRRARSIFLVTRA